jgi:hypothetical protein
VAEERFVEATVPIRVKVIKKGEVPALEVMVRSLPPLADSRSSGGRLGELLQMLFEFVVGCTVLVEAFNATSQAFSSTVASRRALALAVIK